MWYDAKREIAQKLQDVKVNESNIMWYVEINKSIGLTALG